jgi:tetratricopeptide (TPR) repeat protein
MAPEQHRGEPATPRSDQYSFCLSVWHGLFGRHPFVATRWSRVDTIAAMEADRIVEPPRAPKVSARVLRALRRGLRHDPAARWPSMTALLAELEPPSRTAWVLGGLTGAGLIGGAVVMVIVGNVVEDRDPCGNAADRLATIATPERARALADGFAATRLSYATATATRVEAALTDYGARWSAMRIDACRANRVRHDQSDDLFDRRVTCLDERLVALDSALGVLSGQPTAEVVDRAIQVADNLPKLDDCADSARLAALMPEPTDPTRRAAIDRTSAAVAQAEAELEAGHGAHSVATAAQLVADARAIGWAPLTQKALMLAGGADADAGDQDAAVAHFRGASLEAGRAHDDLGAAGALATIARIIADTGKADDALVVLTDAEVLAERIGDPPRLRGEIEEARAIALGNLSRYPESMAAFTKAIALARAAQPRDELWLARVLLAHADVRKGAGDFDAARAAATEAQAIFERVLGPDHPLLVPVHQTLGNIAFQQKQLDVGKAEYAREFAILRARYSETNPRFADAHFNSAMVALHENVLEVAATEFDAARQAYARLAPDHPNTDKARYMLAVTRMFQDKLDEAAALFEESLAYRRAKFGNAALPTADVLDALGQAYAQQHDLAHAMTVRTEALKIREQVLGPNHADVADSLQNLSSLAMDRGDCGQAIALAVRAIAILDRIDGASARTVPALGVLGSCEVRVGKIHDGLAHLAKALTLVEIPGNGDVDQRTTVRTSYGDALWNHGDRAQARALFLEARKLFADADRAADVADTQKWLDAHPAR